VATDSEANKSLDYPFRRWLMPKDFFNDLQDNNLSFSRMFPTKLLTETKEVLNVKNDDKKFELSIDTHGYKPDELKVQIGMCQYKFY
jgi:hypothetical protein